jgi:hypothetical protein
MNPYNGFSGAERIAYDKVLKKEIAAGLYKPKGVCARCGQDKGVIDFHTEDYSLPIKHEHIEELCVRCHMIQHSKRFAADKCAEYFALVAAGKRFPPVLNRRAIFYVLEREHGIVKSSSK